MKWVTRALTGWNVLAPVLFHVPNAILIHRPRWLDWMGEGLFSELWLYFGFAWMLGTPLTAGLAALLAHRQQNKRLRLLNLIALPIWAIGTFLTLALLHL